MSEIHDKILTKFGYPETKIIEYKFWYWLLRPMQTTLGSSIVVIKNHVESIHKLESKIFTELHEIFSEIELTLKRTFDYDKINYLMLMMDDPTLHYHVIPRYKNDKILDGKKYIDIGYPGIPNLSYDNDNNQLHEIKLKIVKNKY